MNCELSVIVPVYNERDNLEAFASALQRVLADSGEDYEVLFVDDGSTDGSIEILERLAAGESRIRLIQFRRNFGQTAALAAGFAFASGRLLVTIDADLQNDPADIPLILAKLREGCDVVSCWRHDRKDSWWTRTLPSRIANLLISRISGVRLHDYGCTLKGYRAEILRHIRLYGEMHRFVPVFAAWAGAQVREIKVRHHARLHGISKYGLDRTYKVILDLITVKLLSSYSTKPMYVFGSTGLLACLAGIGFAGWTLFDKFHSGIKAHNNPMLLLAVFLFLVGVQFILMGLVAEILIRIYYETRGKTPYLIRRTWNLAAEPSTIASSDKSSNP
jgi:glycosyltransferase involved in cell wall biosynthesis